MKNYKIPCLHCGHVIRLFDLDGELISGVNISAYQDHSGREATPKLAVRKNGGKRKYVRKALPKTPFPCTKCGKVWSSNRSRAMHEKMCKGGK